MLGRSEHLENGAGGQRDQLRVTTLWEWRRAACEPPRVDIPFAHHVPVTACFRYRQARPWKPGTPAGTTGLRGSRAGPS
jgi:hypothetical protein